MGTKIGFVLGVGAGVLLMTKLGPGKIATTRAVIDKFSTSAPIQKASQLASDTIGEAIRSQGQAMTDRVAQEVKDRLFTKPDSPDASTAGDAATTDESGVQVGTPDKAASKNPDE